MCMCMCKNDVVLWCVNIASILHPQVNGGTFITIFSNGERERA